MAELLGSYSEMQGTALACPSIARVTHASDPCSIRAEASVMRDFLNIKPLMRAGGCVVFDDVDATAWPGTYRALQALKRQTLNDMTGSLIFGDQVAVFIDRGAFSGK